MYTLVKYSMIWGFEIKKSNIKKGTCVSTCTNLKLFNLGSENACLLWS